MKSEVKTLKHMSGPWRIVQRDEQGAFNGRRITIEGGPGMIADLDWNTPQVNMANARLIAAAPELLEACKALLEEWKSRTAMIESCDLTEEEDRAVELAESAITKAEGVKFGQNER